MSINISVDKGENGMLHTGVLLCHKKNKIYIHMVHMNVVKVVGRLLGEVMELP